MDIEYDALTSHLFPPPPFHAIPLHAAEPPERDETLPDLYRLMASLEDGQTELDTRHEPPSLFTRPEHVSKYKQITDLRVQLEEEHIGDYVGEFEEGVRDDVLMIGSIALDEVQVSAAGGRAGQTAIESRVLGEHSGRVRQP